MLSNISQFFESSPVRVDIALSVISIVGLMLFRAGLIVMSFKRNPNMSLDAKRRSMVVSRNITILACLMALFIIWSSQIQTLALSMVAVAAAMVLATKELIMCLSGSVLRASTRLYSVGDYIEVGEVKGRVIDITMLNTVVKQIGINNHLTGKTVSFANSILLSQNVMKDSVFGAFIVHYFEIPMLITLNPEGAINFVHNKIVQYCSPYLEEADKHFQLLKIEKLYLIPSVEPLVKIEPHNDKLHTLAIRIVVPMKERQRIEQDVIREFLMYQYHQERN